LNQDNVTYNEGGWHTEKTEYDPPANGRKVVFTLKRFHPDPDGARDKKGNVIQVKDHSRVNCPLELTWIEKKFVLVCALFHVGKTSNSGHYNVLRKRRTDWLLCDNLRRETIHVDKVEQFLELRQSKTFLQRLSRLIEYPLSRMTYV
jgi:hypothetical protein